MTASPLPIYNAIFLVRDAIHDALAIRAGGKAYWLQAPQGVALPFVIFQSQDAGGRTERAIGSLAWSGLITVRALAASQSAAETLMQSVAPSMTELYAPGGYRISAAYERPIVISPADNIWQSAHQWRVSLHRS